MEYKADDKVRVFRKLTAAPGWDDSWVDVMDQRVGTVLTVRYDTDPNVNNVKLSDSYNYPKEALMPVSDHEPGILRPFNLKDAQAGYPLVTREGENVKFVSFVEEIETYKVVALVDGCASVDGFTADGKFYSSGDEHRKDLFLKPICYVEGKPVYPGDLLDHIYCGEFYAGHFDGSFIYEYGDVDGVAGGQLPSNCRWPNADEAKDSNPDEVVVEVKAPEGTWVNVYRAEGVLKFGQEWPTKSKAEENSEADVITTVFIPKVA